jgi:hypothetical protein
MASTLIAIDSDGKQHYLNILEGQPITADFNFKDITDLKTKGSHTYNFRLPSSKTNDAYFSSYFMVGSYNDGTNNNFNPFYKAEAYLLQDSIEVFTGYMQLVNVFLRSGNRYEYEVILFSNNVSFIDDLKGLKMSELDYTDYNHAPTIANVYNSYNTNSIASGDVVYSLWDYGSGLATDLSTTFFNTGSGFFPNPDLGGTGSINISTLRPQVRLKALITKLLGHKGYEYESVFFDSAFFSKIYVDANFNGSDSLRSNTPLGYYKVKTQNTGTQAYDYGDNYVILDAPNELLDLDNNYNTTTNIFDVPYTGTYQFTISLDMAKTGGGDMGTNSPCDIGIYLKTSATTYILQTYAGNTFNIGTGTSQTMIAQANLEALQDIVVMVKTPTLEATPQGVGVDITNIYVQIDLIEADLTDGVVSFSSLFGGLKALDFFQSVIKKFNLVVIPNKHNSNQLYIEPYEVYMSQGSSVNWDDKLDFTKDVQIVPPTKFSGRSVLFKDTPSEDYVYQSFATATPYTFGQYELQLGNEFTERTNDFTSVFSPTINYPIEIAGFYTSPIITRDADGFKNVGGIRLSFYHGTKTVTNGYYYKLAEVNSPVGDSKNVAPYFSAFSEQDFSTSTDVITINWGCTLSDTLTTWETIPLNGLAVKYWYKYLKNNFDINSRMLIGYFRLTPRDIADFNFNNTIKINGEDYIINSIKGYPISSAGLCKVELLKSFANFSETVPLPPPPNDCSAEGMAYVQDGQIFSSVSSSSVSEACCSLWVDWGINTYWYNSACWLQPPDDTPDQSSGERASITTDVVGSNNVYNFVEGGSINGNNNQVVNSIRDVNVKGDSNLVKSRTKKIDITGDDNTVYENVNDATIIGTGNIILPASDNQTLHGEPLIYTNKLSNINITGEYGKALNNNEVIISKGSSAKEGTSQVAEHILKTTIAGGSREAWIGQLGAFTTYPNTATYNSELATNSFRLPDKTIVKMTVTIQATTGTTANALNTQTWDEVNEYKLLSGTAPILISSNQVSSSQTSDFSGATIELLPSSNLPYIYNSYLLYLRLPFSTLVNDCTYNIKTQYTTSVLSGTVVSNITPTDITGCVLWLDASNFSSVTFNSSVGTGHSINAWNDISGGYNHVLQLSSTYMPKWVSGSVGRPYIDFDGTSAVLWNADADLVDLATTNNTFIAVFESDITTAETYGQVVTGINSTSSVPRAGITVNPSAYGGGGVDSVSYYNENTVANMFQCNIGSAGVTDRKIVIGRRDGANLDIIDENGTTDTYSLASSPTDGHYFTVGGRFNGTYDYSEFNGKIHEIIAYDNKISDADREKLIYYLKNKWNIL